MTEHHPKLDAFRIAFLFTPAHQPPDPPPKPRLHEKTRSNHLEEEARRSTSRYTRKNHHRKTPSGSHSLQIRPNLTHPHPTPPYHRPPVPRYTPAAIEETLAEPQSTPFLYPHNLDPFFQSLAAEQAEHAPNPNAQSTIPALASTIRILQFGDSHTAADLFTGDLRAQFQSRFGNGGLGFQFPGHPFAGYHLAGSTRTQTPGWTTEGNKFTQLGDAALGLGGISLSTTRPGESIQLITTCSTFQIHYLIQPGGGTLRFTDNGTYISDLDTSNGTAKAVSTSPDASQTSSTTDEAAAPPVSTFTTGTPGTLTYACTSGDHDLRLTTLDRAPVRLLGLVTEQPGITYECLGINGAVATLMLRWNQTPLRRLSPPALPQPHRPRLRHQRSRRPPRGLPRPV